MLSEIVDRLGRMGRRIPQDMSVVAICSDAAALRSTPPLSNVSIPVSEIGRIASNLLAGLIDGDPVSGPVLVAPHLQVRSSTGLHPSTP